MKSSRCCLFAAFVAGALILLPGCESADKTTTPNTTALGVMNEKCPFTGAPVNKSVTSTYQGKTVAFCCAGCQGRFNSMTDAQKDEKLAAMARQ